MAVTDDQYHKVLSRLTNVESVLNNTVTAIQKFITLEQANQLQIILESEMEDFNIRVAALEDRVTLIENEPLT